MPTAGGPTKAGTGADPQSLSSLPSQSPVLPAVSAPAPGQTLCLRWYVLTQLHALDQSLAGLSSLA